MTTSLAACLAAAAQDLPPMLTCQEAAEFLKVCDRTIRRMIASGRLKAAKVNPGNSGRVVIPRAAVVAMLTGE